MSRGYTLARLADLTHCRFLESQAGTATGDAYAMKYVAAGRVDRHGRQRAGETDALFQLPHRLLRETAIEFRLSNDDDLQEFELFGFEVCQEPQGFERHIGQLMRFVDNEYDPCPRALQGSGDDA